MANGQWAALVHVGWVALARGDDDRTVAVSLEEAATASTPNSLEAFRR